MLFAFKLHVGLCVLTFVGFEKQFGFQTILERAEQFGVFAVIRKQV